MLRPLSALEAIDPAWQHTRRLMLRPGGKRTLFKIAAVAFFAEMGGCNPNVNRTGQLAQHVPPVVAASLAAFFVLAALVTLVFALGFFYLSSRLQLVLFDVVLRSDTTIGPIWRRVGSLTWRWIGLKLLYFLAFLVALLPFLIPAGLLLYRTLRNHAGDHVSAGSAFAGFIGLFAGFFLVLLLFSMFYTLLRDFSIPSLVLENTPLREAVSRVLRLCRLEPGQVVLFLLMRFVMGLAGALASYLVILTATLLACIPLGGAAFALYAVFKHAGTGGHLLMVAGWIVLGLILAAFVIMQFITLLGYMVTFLQAYVVYFLAGRYPLLGEVLMQNSPTSPGMPPPPTTTPQAYADTPPNPYAYLNLPPTPPSV